MKLICVSCNWNSNFSSTSLWLFVSGFLLVWLINRSFNLLFLRLDVDLSCPYIMLYITIPDLNIQCMVDTKASSPAWISSPIISSQPSDFPSFRFYIASRTSSNKCSCSLNMISIECVLWAGCTIPDTFIHNSSSIFLIYLYHRYGVAISAIDYVWGRIL